MDDILQESQEQIEPVELPANLESPQKSFSSPLERNKYILERYIKGAKQLDIGKEVGLSEVRIGQIVKKHSHLIELDRQHEKMRRIHRLKLAESKAPNTLAPKDADQLVRILEQQRKELEGNSEDRVVNNTQINIRGDVNLLAPSDKWNALRSMLESE